jgi:hypothetical protein
VQAKLEYRSRAMSAVPGASRLLRLTAVALAVAGASFNESRAIEYAKLAGAAGCLLGDADAVASWSCGFKCEVPVSSVKVCTGNVISAFVALWEGKCIMSFQGTHDVTSFLADLRVLQNTEPWGASSCPGCRVHAGFLRAYEGVKPCVLAAMKDRGCDAAPIRSTGWSLGAAASSLAMFDLSQQGWRIEESYDFGKPRVGNQAFAAAFETRFAGIAWRVTHGHDPVPHLPPSDTFNDQHFVQLEPEAFYADDLAAGHAECFLERDAHCSANNPWMPINFMLHVTDHFYYMDIRQGYKNCSGGPRSLFV